MFDEFRKFAMRGNVVDLAVGFTVGAAFTAVAHSLVDDIIMPPLGLLLGDVNFINLYWLLKPGTQTPPPYTTLADAKAAGAVTLNYGTFINNVITLALIALAMYFIVRLINRIDAQLEADFAPKQTETA